MARLIRQASSESFQKFRKIHFSQPMPDEILRELEFAMLAKNEKGFRPILDKGGLDAR